MTPKKDEYMRGYAEGFKEASAGIVTEFAVELKTLSDRAYCQFITQCEKAECLGEDAKLSRGSFGKAELHAHRVAHQYLGAHRAFAEAIQLLRHGPTRTAKAEGKPTDVGRPVPKHGSGP